MSEPLLYADDVELMPEDEATDIQRVLLAMQTLLQRQFEKTGRPTADVHVKSNGIAHAEFRVLPNLPAELAQGLFQRDKTFSAVIRFSNSANQTQSDWLPGGRGLAIKLLGVDGEMLLGHEGDARTQDFVMINHPVFFAGNVKDFARLEQVLVEANDNPFAVLQGGLTGGDWKPWNWHWREMLTAVQTVGHVPSHPASNTYCSAAPIRFGRYIAKYRIRPSGVPSTSFLEVIRQLGHEADALRLMLTETLKAEQILLEFQVQLRTNKDTMPIEDASVEWPESQSAFRTVAHCLLPRQELGPPAQRPGCHFLSFNVWHALAAHRPLGGINRLRREAYEVSSAWRYRIAGQPRKEPESINDLFHLESHPV